jgi:hypothetical protein
MKRSSRINLVALLAVSTLAGVGCTKRENDLGWWSGENTRIELTQQLALAQYRLEQATPRIEAHQEMESLAVRNASAVKTLTHLRELKSTLLTHCEQQENAFAVYQSDVIRQRQQAAVGKRFDVLEVSNGKRFEDAQIVSVDTAGVQIRHRDGSARLGFDDLTADQSAQFGIERHTALEAERVEREQAIAYERWIEAELAVIEEKERVERASAAREASSRQASLLAAAATTRPRVSALAAPARSFGSRSSSYYSRSYYSRPRSSTWIYYQSYPTNYYRPSVVYPQSQLNILRPAPPTIFSGGTITPVRPSPVFPCQ